MQRRQKNQFSFLRSKAIGSCRVHSKLRLSGYGLLAFFYLILPLTAEPLRVGGDRNYPPFEFLDESGQPAGFNVDLMKAVARAADLEIVIELDNWSKVRKKVVTGDLDVLLGMVHSSERDKFVDFTAPPRHCLSCGFCKQFSS